MTVALAEAISETRSAEEAARERFFAAAARVVARPSGRRAIENLRAAVGSQNHHKMLWFSTELLANRITWGNYPWYAELDAAFEALAAISIARLEG